MRILLANASAFPHIGGVENSLRFIARELVAAGHEVKVLCLQLTSDEPLLAVHDDVEIIRIPQRPSRWPHKRVLGTVAAVATSARAVLEDYSPDAVWCRSAAFGLGLRHAGFAGPLVQIYPTNAYMNCRGMYLNTNGLPLARRILLLGLMPLDFIASKRVERELFSKSIGVTFSHVMRRSLEAAFPRATAQVAVVPPGVDKEKFSPEAGARQIADIQRRFGLDPDEKVVLYVGRLSSAKNVPLLIDAVAIARSRPTLVLVGAGSERDALEKYAQRRGITAKFVGAQSDLLPGFYALSRACVLPTTIESFGQVFLESLSCGTPIVGFSSRGRKVLTATEEIVLQGKTGISVSEVSPAALSNAIDELIQAPRERLEGMREACRSDATKRFSWRRFVHDVLKLHHDFGENNWRSPASRKEGN